MSACRLILLSVVVVLLSAATLTEGMRYKAKTNACCYSFYQRPLKSSMVASYSLTSPQCSKQAILFKTKRGKDVCANPIDAWVKELVTFLDSKLGSQGPM
ncbi:hypothetical protein QTP70_029256 [Hemibagrus guttatus]|uniref:C-C motif chemokine n=1 Tax=Hemibagrus guttatus TaxID=175788 RepID=A0AAE0QZR1_9TELE|nr:hypothetical protein QTP70_029256 [Hemibagrus guttatus]